MPRFETRRDDFKEAVISFLESNPLAQHIGVVLESTEPGRVVCSLEFRPELSQQNGFVHGGILTALADVAAGFAAYTLMAAGENVLSSNIHVSLLRPAKGERIRAVGRVVKAGSRVYFTEADVYSIEGDSEILTTKVSATMIVK